MTFLLKNVICVTFGTKFVITLSSCLFMFSTLNVTLTSEHDTDEFYNSNSKKMFL